MFTSFKKACFAFDMMSQLLVPLKLLHQAKYVHGDIKPDNICVRPLTVEEKKENWLCKNQSTRAEEFTESKLFQSDFLFTLIDFGIISKFKVKKASR